MSQLVACVTGDAVIMAADRRIEVRGDAETTVHAARKLFAVGDGVAIASSGAAVGVKITQAVAHAFAKRPKVTFAEAEEYALGVFGRDYAAFVAHGAEWFAAHPEALKLSYVLIGGVDADGTRHLKFHASECHGEPYRSLPVGAVLAAPRRLGLETRLTQALMAKKTTLEIKAMLLTHLTRIAELDSAVGGPFDVAVISASGVALETVERI